MQYSVFFAELQNKNTRQIGPTQQKSISLVRISSKMHCFTKKPNGNFACHTTVHHTSTHGYKHAKLLMKMFMSLLRPCRVDTPVAMKYSRLNPIVLVIARQQIQHV
jgi:hypothetical protein